MRKLLVLFLLALAPYGSAQRLTETIEVRVANVDVVVTDRSGHPIQGLTKDDFELYENQKLQPITNFYEIRAEAPAAAASPSAPAEAPAPVVPSEMRQRSIVVFIDNSSIEPFRRNKAIDAITLALDTLMRSGDDAMIIAFSQRTEVLQPFTNDRALLKRTLEGARKVTAASSTISWQKSEVISVARNELSDATQHRKSAAEAYASSVGKARAYADWRMQSEKQLLASLVRSVSMLSGIEGKKVLVFVGGELEQTPGLDVFQIVDSMFTSIVRNMMPAVIRENDKNMSIDLGKVATNANANGVTMYMMDVLDRSRDSSDPGLTDPEITFTNETNSYLSMATLASSTGGTVLSGTANFGAALDNIARDLGSYYSLGYRPGEGRVDRSITVKVKRPGAFVRSRRGYALKTAEQQVEDHVIANAFHATLKSDFPVTIETDKPEPFEKGLFKVKVTLTFPSTLTYLPSGEDLSGEFAVSFVTAGEDGSLSPVRTAVHQVKFPAQSEAEVKQKPFTHTTGLVVRGGTQTISVVVVDRVGARNGYAKATIIAR
jgi:VWFA-related protein